ncbi:hypothetical protein [Nonomuraea sp. NPDC050643]|uniref:hypothetical protein n=1 Tax=Nonomuraea sp. NPDC050643 TaxID=3155660 RepID=UPI0033DD6F26
MRLRDIPLNLVKPGQLIAARRLHTSNPAARAELDALNEQADTDPSMTNATYLKREAEIIARHR